MNVPIGSIIIGVIGVVLSVAMLWSSARTLKATMIMARIAEDERKLRETPYIEASVELEKRASVALVLTNTGGGSAKNIEWWLEIPRGQGKRWVEAGGPPEPGRQKLYTLAPGKQIRIGIGGWRGLAGMEATSPEEKETTFKVEMRYENSSGASFSQSPTLDLNSVRSLGRLPRGP